MELEWGPFPMYKLRGLFDDDDDNDDDDGAKGEATANAAAATASGGVVAAVQQRKKEKIMTKIGGGAESDRRINATGNRPRIRSRRRRMGLTSSSSSSSWTTPPSSWAPASSEEAVVPQTLLINDLDRSVPALADYLDASFFADLMLRSGRTGSRTANSDDESSQKGGRCPDNERHDCFTLPRWRRDDAQLSISSAGGGIGPHTDSYDVFLVQIAGTKSWTVSQHPMSHSEELERTIPDLDVRVLDLTNNNFCRVVLMREPVILEPGDVLYVPPRYVHDGVALTSNCQTLSVGCRAPSALELLLRVAELTSSSSSSATLVSSSAGQGSRRNVLEAAAARYAEEDLSIAARDLLGQAADAAAASTISHNVKEKMKGLVRDVVESVLGDDLLWDELVGRLVTASPRQDIGFGGVSGATTAAAKTTKTDDAEASWQRRPGVSMATTFPSPHHVRFFCGGDMYEAVFPSPDDAEKADEEEEEAAGASNLQQQQQALLSVLRDVESGAVISRKSVATALDMGSSYSFSSSSPSSELWNRLVEDGVVIRLSPRKS
jgi:hypothetical protein